MGLESAFVNLCAQLQTLQEALHSLHTTVVEDRPLHGDVVLVDVFGDAADDLLGWLTEANDAASDGRLAATPPVDLNRMRPALITCQARVSRVAQRFSSDLMCYERIAELLRCGRARGGEWWAWARSVKAALDCCRQPLFDIDEALFSCWQELVERAETRSVAVQTTNVGQQLSPPPGRAAA
jgi:hypothetical protein